MKTPTDSTAPRRATSPRQLCVALIPAVMVVVLGLYLHTNLPHARDERSARTIWIRENGRMLQFLADNVTPATRVYQFNCDHECAVTLDRYVRHIHARDVAEWITLPVCVAPQNEQQALYRSREQMTELFNQARRGDLLLVPVHRSAVGYTRMPLFEHSAGLFPHIVPQPLRTRLHKVYSSFDRFDHRSIPLYIQAGLRQQGRAHVLAEARARGLAFGFGWDIYRVGQRAGGGAAPGTPDGQDRGDANEREQEESAGQQ